MILPYIALDIDKELEEIKKEFEKIETHKIRQKEKE